MTKTDWSQKSTISYKSCILYKSSHFWDSKTRMRNKGYEDRLIPRPLLVICHFKNQAFGLLPILLPLLLISFSPHSFIHHSFNQSLLQHVSMKYSSSGIELLLFVCVFSITFGFKCDLGPSNVIFLLHSTYTISNEYFEEFKMFACSLATSFNMGRGEMVWICLLQTDFFKSGKDRYHTIKSDEKYGLRIAKFINYSGGQ